VQDGQDRREEERRHHGADDLRDLNTPQPLSKKSSRLRTSITI
jgi:hypothetical protein